MTTSFAQELFSAIQVHSSTPSTFPAKPTPPNDLERMARLVRDNDRLSAELRSVRAQLTEARLYLDRPGSNRPLAHAHLQRLQLRRSRTLALLRSNRLEGQALLARHSSI